LKLALLSVLILASATAQPLSIERKNSVQRGPITIEDITFLNLAGRRTSAYLVLPHAKTRTAGALFVHWYDPSQPTSNRTQFREEAVSLAAHGLVSLLVETPWSDPNFYLNRDVSRDYEFSVQEIKELSRDLDVLLAQHRVDKKRIAYIGHDFGAMYGIDMAAMDNRVTVGAFQAGNSNFGEWMLYNQQKLSAEGKTQVMDRMAPLDPVSNIAGLLGRPILLQFSNKDFYVPLDRAKALADAAREPKQVLYYDAGHGLNEQASKDRQQFLIEKLNLH
jgi:pimeloyl-ACP methyl ester carboxylesterase